MSHSPAYYQENGQLVTTYLHDGQQPITIPATHHPSESSSLRHSQQQKSAVSVTPSDLNSVGHVDSHDLLRHEQQPQKGGNYNSQLPVGFVYPISEQLVVAPVTFVSSSSVENAPILTRTSNSNGVVRKEDRVRGSWTDHSSYMSGDPYQHSAPRIHKRAIPEDDAPANDSQDALSLLFRLSLLVPIFSLCTSLYTLFGLFFVVLVSPLRLCSFVPYLRSTSFRAQLCDLLVPQLHIHERLVYLRGSTGSHSSSTQWIYDDPEGSTSAEAMECYSVGGLLMVLLVSSLLSIAFLLLVWTAAFFWVFAMILGNPDGTERKDDGRAAVLGVVRWWQLWLGKARKSLN
ncbi:uncharacterized protein ACLA_070770 [Aspergillus clavatus NRRL 1]|uniref:Uncharacterized protein n=1 Tax=Aspergillus clavatus (strain ATCC 1007 / CBS 513.65 / DSM 816 / NCTC 3887 / NRRL 1 / QM 1276 / 107) TaxID=344612 RepID=A1C6M3_ASPCL|nr:uncharacterized protein ACLA_070770 [Aspergillus clavatus NRRL 1]EAW14044.1 conserved hypothetical protein [Aspergillus clavatus NRRL 1]